MQLILKHRKVTKLKNIILFLLLISSLFAKEQVYFGASYGIFDENFNNDIEAENSSQLAKIKVGYGVRDAYAVEFSLEYIDNKSKIFSSSSKSDGTKYGMNIDLLKSFDLDIYLLPFLKAGFGAGFLKIDRVLQDELRFGSFNLGTGIFIPINKNFDFELGFDYRYTTYESIDTVAKKLMYKSNINVAYLGFNIRY